MSNTDIEAQYPDLTKWPLLLVTGEKVTHEQAAEILLRTNGQYLHSNDKKYVRALRVALGLPEDVDYSRMPQGENISDARLQEWHDYVNKHYQDEGDAWSTLGALDLEYLSNSQLASSWIGGVHGWVDWNGNIGTSNYNIGKWPSVSIIFDELKEIAQAFPYLKMTVQLVANEGAGNGSYDDGDGQAAVEFEVIEGVVVHRQPGDRITGVTSLTPEEIVHSLTSGGGERATVTLDYIKNAADKIRNK